MRAAANPICTSEPQSRKSLDASHPRNMCQVTADFSWLQKPFREMTDKVASSCISDILIGYTAVYVLFLCFLVFRVSSNLYAGIKRLFIADLLGRLLQRPFPKRCLAVQASSRHRPGIVATELAKVRGLVQVGKIQRSRQAQNVEMGDEMGDGMLF